MSEGVLQWWACAGRSAVLWCGLHGHPLHPLSLLPSLHMPALRQPTPRQALRCLEEPEQMRR